MNYKYFGKNVRSLRKYQGHNIDWLVKNSGVSKGALSKIENGGNCTIMNACKIAKALGATIHSLLEKV